MLINSKQLVAAFTAAIIFLSATACKQDKHAQLEPPEILSSSVPSYASGNSSDYGLANDSAVVVKSVTNSGNFYPNPNDPMAAFDGKADTYLAGIEGQGPWWLEGEFEQPQILRDIEIEFYSIYDYSTDFTLEGYAGGAWETILTEKNLKLDAYSRSYYCRIALDQRFQGFKMTIAEVTGQNRPLIKNIRFNVTDPSKKHYSNATELTEEIIGDRNYLTDYQKCMLVMKWIADNNREGLGTGDSYQDINMKKGACGDVSSIMVACVNAMGMEARRIGIYNALWVGYSHVGVEVNWDGKWHFFDPFLGTVYFVKADDIGNFRNPNIASIDEIKENPELTKNKLTLYLDKAYSSVLANPYSFKNMIMSIDLEVLDTDELGRYIFPEGSHTYPGFYVSAEPIGPIGAEYPMIFPAYFSLEDGKAGYGSANGMVDDMISPGQIYANIYFIGSSYSNVNQEYRMTALNPGREYRLKIGFLSANNIQRSFEIEITGESLEITGETKAALQNGDTLTVQFVPSSDEATLRLSHNYTNGEHISLDYIEISEN